MDYFDKNASTRKHRSTKNKIPASYILTPILPSRKTQNPINGTNLSISSLLLASAKFHHSFQKILIRIQEIASRKMMDNQVCILFYLKEKINLFVHSHIMLWTKKLNFVRICLHHQTIEFEVLLKFHNHNIMLRVSRSLCSILKSLSIFLLNCLNPLHQ